MGFNEIKQHGTQDFPIELYSLYPFSPKYEMVHHWHKEIELIRVTKGNLYLTLGKNTYFLERGKAAVVNSDTLHGAIPEKNCEYSCAVFDPLGFATPQQSVQSFVNEIKSGQISFCEVPEDKRALEAINAVFGALESGASGRLPYVKMETVSAIYNFYGTFLRLGLVNRTNTDSVAQNKDSVKLKRTLEYIRQNYSRQINLTDMANVCGMSPKYFCEYFKSMTGHTPVEYLNVYRISKAAKLLLNTDEPVTQIALDCGYNDLSYFIKQFGKHKGMSPGKFRKERTDTV